MTIDADPRPLRQMLQELSADLRALAARSMDLARAEISTAASEVTRSLIGIAAGAFAALAGVLVLVSMLVLIAVALGLPPWAAAALVGLLLTIAGVFTVRTFIARLRTAHFDLRETRSSVTETVEWLKAQTNR
jgi:hypothetical protein